MKKRILRLVIGATFLLAGVLLWQTFNKEPDLPSFWWHGYNENCSVSLLTPNDSDYVYLESYENDPVDWTTLDGGVYMEGTRRLEGDKLTLKMDDGTIITAVLYGDTMQLDYAGGILLESYERLKERRSDE